MPARQKHDPKLEEARRKRAEELLAKEKEYERLMAEAMDDADDLVEDVEDHHEKAIEIRQRAEVKTIFADDSKRRKPRTQVFRKKRKA